MYTRYKSDGRSKSVLKIAITLVFFAIIIVLLVQYHEYLMFWKYSINEISDELQQVAELEDVDERIKRLESVLEKSIKYTEENRLSAAAYFKQAHLYSQLGEAYANITITDYVISGGTLKFGKRSRDAFLHAIKMGRKGFAIAEGDAVGDKERLLMAKLYLYTGYYGEDLIASLAAEVAEPTELKDRDDRRLLGFLQVVGDAVTEGIAYLREYGSIVSFEDKVFLAGVYKRAGQYTDAIETYKKLMSDASFAQYEVVVRKNLGEVYFEQSLFNEALEQFSKLLLLEPDNKEIKKLLGKTYLELGDKKSADGYLDSI